MPRPEAYFAPINWHRTALHELGHWSGHPSRLGRDLSGNFGSALYAKEELIALSGQSGRGLSGQLGRLRNFLMHPFEAILPR